MGANVKRTTVDLDLDEVARAKQVLGTATTRETISAALRQVARRAALAEAAEYVRSGRMQVVSPEELAELRRVRLDP